MPSGLILGIESSCDKTSAAVVRSGREVLSNVVASQLIHSDYGGVVPELASREHLRNIVPVVHQALQIAGVTYTDIDAIAVTEGPGLAGALLVGITFAKALALGTSLPLIGVNHLEGHIHAVLMDSVTSTGPWALDAGPSLALVVSGGHTHLYLATREDQTWRYRNVGKTLDDAAGEAYDKVAKLLGLPYPGGPWMDALAAHGDPRAVPFTFAQLKDKGRTAPKLARELAALKGTGFSPSMSTTQDEGALAPEATSIPRFDFSFSGIKTAVLRYVETHEMKPRIALRDRQLRALGPTAKPNDPAVLDLFDTQTLNLIASFQHSVTGYLTRNAFAAAEAHGARALLVTGGVAANSELRRRIAAEAGRRNLPIAFPQISLSTDNAAMIAAAAWPKLLARTFAPDTLEPTPQLRLG